MCHTQSNSVRSEPLTFLGTGAAQGFPPVYAADLEHRSRTIAGTSHSDEDSSGHDRNLRTRSSFRIGTKHQIDAPSDMFWQLAREGMSWYGLEHLIITHTHSDHFYFDGILQKQNATHNNGRQLTIHMSRPALNWFLTTWFVMKSLRMPDESEIETARRELEQWYVFKTIAPYEWHEIGDLHVCPVPGTHTGRVPEDVAMNLIVELQSGYRFLYGLDTGYYSEETFEFLGTMELDMVVLDCTFGGRSDRPEYPYGHLDCASFIKVLERLESLGPIDTTTPVYASHINPDQGLDHAGLESRFAGERFAVHTAWDGLRLQP